jgi:hypothetical protein
MGRHQTDGCIIQVHSDAYSALVPAQPG